MKTVCYERINKSREYLSSLGKIDCKALFGGYSLAVENTIFAMVSDGELYLRAGEGCPIYSSQGVPTMLTFPRYGRIISLNYFLVDEALWREPEKLLHLSQCALEDARKEKEKKESLKRLKDLPNITFQLDVHLCDVDIRDVETLKACGPREAWLRMRKNNKHIGIRVLMSLAGAIEGIHAAALPVKLRQELYDWYHQITRQNG